MSLLSQLGIMGAPASSDEVGLESSVKGADLVMMTMAGLQSGEAIAESNAELTAITADVALLDSLVGVETRISGIVSSISNIAVDGMTQREAQFINDSVNQINAELGAEVLAMPAVESYGDRISAKTFTEVAVESAADAAKKVWKFIIDTINKIKDTFATWWDKFFGSVEGLVKYADKVKAGAEKYNEDKDNKKVSLKGRALFTDGTKPDAGKINAGSKALLDSVKEYLVKQSTAAEKACDQFTKALDKADGGKAADMDAAGAEVFKDEASKFTTGAHIGANKEGVLFGKEIIGEKHVFIANVAATFAGGTAEERINGYKALAKVSYAVKANDPKAKSDVTTEIDRLSKDEVVAVAENIKEMAEAILDTRKSRQDARTYSENLVKASERCQKTAQSLSTEDKGNKAEMVELAKASIAVLKEVAGGSVAAWTAHLVSTGNAALKAAEASI